MPDFNPKIYSLSTLNIRQHYNCDYRFHNFRTDFCGESGSGKSLIADLIQLLLVGSSVFKSGTEGVKQRDTSGLVLKGIGANYGRGYIMINVELQPRKYLTLGGYLETSSSQMQFFIIQAGYDYDDTLLPMDKPIFYRDLLVDGKIEPVERLQQTFQDKGYLKVVNTRKYHQLLFNNGILALDLSQNKQSLKTYAVIIRSFSRGRGFFTDSDALKTFLFGDDDQKRLLEKYDYEVQNINVDQQQHQRLMEEIAMIRSKEKKIENVLRNFNNYNRLKLKFSLDNTCFWFQEHKRADKDVQNVMQQYQQSALKRIFINKRILGTEIDDIQIQQQQVKNLTIKIKRSVIESETWKSKLQNAKILLDQSTRQIDIIKKVSQWFGAERMDIEAVRKWYSIEREKNEDVNLLNKFVQFLNQNNLTHEFEQSDWFSNFPQATKLTRQKLETIETTIARYETQLIFSDLQNPDSLAHWAIQNLTLPLSLEQESMLIYFQSFSRTEPLIPAGRYLPFPERLFDDPIIVRTQRDGFWVELNGIYEFIDHVSVRYLNVPSDKINLSCTPLVTLKHKLEQLKKNYQQLTTLKEKLENYPALEKVIVLYRTFQASLFSEFDEVAELTFSEFEHHISIYAAAERYLSENEKIETAYNEIYENVLNSQNANIILQNQINQIESNCEKLYGSIIFDDLLTERRHKLFNWEGKLNSILETEKVKVHDIQKQEAEIFKFPTALITLHEMAISLESEYKDGQKQVDEKQEYYTSSKVSLNNARLKFIESHQRDFDSNQDFATVDHQPDDATTTEAFNKFKLSYELASEGIEDQTILKDYSVGILAHKLLPTVFPSYHIKEELIGEQIDMRLSDLTNDLQRIGSRKIEILHNVFNEVQKTFNEYLTKVQKINSYLRSKDRQITGGNHASLQHRPASGYPDNWMKIFRKRLNEEMQNTGIFAANNKQDIDAIMISVFRAAGGTKEAKYEDLLNPLSYFDLLFDIKLEDGQSNAGSNGQTYTANALLCLARLSLIEDDNHSGIKIMPIDEAEGLGGNFEMLHALAKKEQYQIVSMSIETAGDINNEGQYIYIMHDNKEVDELTYIPPLGIFSRGIITENINEIFEKTQ